MCRLRWAGGKLPVNPATQQWTARLAVTPQAQPQPALSGIQVSPGLAPGGAEAGAGVA
jgi:hypothetical protein